jgi:HK97 family phage portal protein
LLEALRSRLGLFPDRPLPNGSNGNGKAADPAESKGVTLSLDPTIEFFSPDTSLQNITRLFGGSTTDVDRVSRATAFAASAYCYVAIRWRMRKIAEAPLIVMRSEGRQTSTGEWLPDHPLAQLLDEPSPDFDMGALIQRTVAHLDVHGQTLWLKDSNRGGSIGRLTPFPGSQFTVEAADGRIYGRFRIQTATGTLEVGPDDVVFFQEAHPDDWHHGMSKVDVALSWLNLGKHALASTKDILRNALFPSVIVQTDKDWDPGDDEWNKFKQQLREYARREHKGGPLGLLGGGTATKVGLTLKDLIPGDILSRVESVVAATFGVPAVVLQYQIGLENAPWSNMPEARRMAYEDTIQPDWTQISKAITRQLLWAPSRTGARPFESDRKRIVVFDTSHVRALQPDLKLMSEVAERQRRIASLNERREMVGLDPVDDPRADVVPELMEPEQGVGSEAEFANPFALPAADEDDEGAEAAGRTPAFHVKTSKAEVWARFDRETKQATDAWEGPIADELAVQGDTIARLAERTLKQSAPAGLETKEIDEALVAALLIELDRWLKARGVPRMRAISYPLIHQTSKAAIRAASGQVGLTFSLLQAGLTEYAAAEAEFLASVMGETTGKAVAEVVQAGLDAGDTVGRLVKRIRESSGFSRDRAKLVARTETSRAWNGAQTRSLQAYEERTPGVAVYKVWLTSQDDRVRDEHVEMEGQRRKVGETYSNGSMEPSDPNERCTQIFELEEAA